MNKFKNLSLLIFICLFYFNGKAQDLRIDFKRINSEIALQKTNGGYMNYLEKETQKLKKRFGLLSKEYVYFRGYYLEEYAKIYQPYSNQDIALLREYAEGRKELLGLTKAVYGDTSWVYANAIISFGVNYTSIWNTALSDSTFTALMSLTDKAIEITNLTKSVTEWDRFGGLSLLYAQKGDVYRKVNQKDSAIKYYNIVLKILEEHPSYDRFYPPFLTMYANTFEDNRQGLDFLIKYEPIIKKEYIKNKRGEYYNFICSIINHYLRQNYIDKNALEYVISADSICKNLYGELSKEYVSFILSIKISAFKKMGWKSEVFQTLAILDNDIFKRKENLLIQDDNIYKGYYLEWCNYYQSIGEESEGLKYLKLLEKNEKDSIFNRNTFSNKLEIYRKLGEYYRFRDFDSCIFYSKKILNLEIRAKDIWGDYVIHQYLEIAKLIINSSDKPNYELANNFCYFAAIEFKNSYGLDSYYYKNMMFTHGRLFFKTGEKLKGLYEMSKMVYIQYDNKSFIPPLTSSIFEVYGDCLNQVNKYDSADFFYNEIYLRNSSAQFFRIIGNSSEYQIKGLEEIYNQNSIILTQHLNRYKSYQYDSVSIELAEKLFKKNFIYQIQSYTNEALKNISSKKEIKDLNRIINSKKKYDSLICSSYSNQERVELAYEQFELNKNQFLQNYIFNNAADSSKLLNLKNEYSYKVIQNRLKDGECLIDIVRFLEYEKELGFNNTPSYAIVILDKNSKANLKYFFIRDGAALDKAILDCEFGKVSLIFSDLISKINAYKKIYVNADGAFNLLNFYALKDNRDDYLIRNKIFVYINTLAGITDPIERPSFKKSAIFFGNPLFNKEPKQGGERNSIFPLGIGSNLRELPYSKIEIETATKSLNSKGWNTKKFIGELMNEENLKNDTTADILHIATHGYYISESDNSSSSNSFKTNPYLKSGLILGKINSNGKNLNDNVLTAYEAMDLNLRNTSLVVLSACESAKGELKPGQGIYGLQRAFKIAGAKNVLVSVKNVDDKATQILMGYFYENVANGNSYTSSLRNAQLQMIKNPLFNDFKYWSGFILVGQ